MHLQGNINQTTMSDRFLFSSYKMLKFFIYKLPKILLNI